jgi:4-oxalocrotonate tautomerase
VPHVHISHFPKELDQEGRDALAADLTQALVRAFGVDEGAVSVALEPVDASDWQQRVYRPQILDRADLLIKTPAY